MPPKKRWEGWGGANKCNHTTKPTVTATSPSTPGSRRNVGALPPSARDAIWQTRDALDRAASSPSAADCARRSALRRVDSRVSNINDPAVSLHRQVVATRLAHNDVERHGVP